MMKKEDLQKLLDKYLKGECSPEEVAEVHRWYNAFEHEADPLEVLSDTQQQLVKDRLRGRIKASLTIAESATERSASHVPRLRTLIYTLSGVAAMIVMVLGISFMNRNASDSKRIAIHEKILFNKTKSIQKILLSDGSIVWLSPQSRITYPQQFGGTTREVKMEGEVFFEVVRNHKQPFIIHSGHVLTKVLGTSFRIRAFKNVPLEISVVTGKVSVKLKTAEHSEVMLLPNQKAIYLDGAEYLSTGREKQTSAMRMWKKASLSFDNTPIRTVIKSLSKEFGVNIHAKGEEFAAYTLNADFENRSLPSILEMLEKSLNITYEINNQEIILKSKDPLIPVTL